MIRIGLTTILTVLIAAVTGQTGCAEQASVTIATAAPLTGPYARFGRQMKAGAALAVADMNRAGGISINGSRLRVKLIVADDGCDEPGARDLAGRLAARGVIFVAGHFCSGASIAAAQVYAQKGVILISPASRHPRLTDNRAGPSIFRLSGRDDRQGLIAGRHLATAFRGKRIAIIHDGTLYARKLAVEVKAALNGRGIKENVFARFRPGRNDYVRLLNKLARTRIGVVYIAGYVTEVALFARRQADRAMSLELMSSDVVAAREFLQIAGEAGDGVLLTAAPDPSGSRRAGAVAAGLRARGIEPDATALYTYGAVETWRQAVEQAKSLDTGAIAAALSSSAFDTVLGRFWFDAKGDSSLPPYAVYKWSNGVLEGWQPAGR